MPVFALRRRRPHPGCSTAYPVSTATRTCCGLAGHTTGNGRSGPAGARLLLEALLGRRTVQSSPESKTLLRSFGVPVTPGTLAQDATEALFAAEQTGFPVVMKIDSPACPTTGPTLAEYASTWARRNRCGAPSTTYSPRCAPTIRRARINGVSLEPLSASAHGRELRLTVFRDPVFGPVIGLGTGLARGSAATTTRPLPCRPSTPCWPAT